MLQNAVNKCKRWTTEEEEIYKPLFLQKKSYAEIAQAIGRTPAAMPYRKHKFVYELKENGKTEEEIKNMIDFSDCTYQFSYDTGKRLVEEQRARELKNNDKPELKQEVDKKIQNKQVKQVRQVKQENKSKTVTNSFDVETQELKILIDRRDLLINSGYIKEGNELSIIIDNIVAQLVEKTKELYRNNDENTKK